MVAAGADLHEAMRVANHAAGIVVGKLGTAVVHREELRESLATIPDEREGAQVTLIVTGAAGFIGANLVKALNERGETDIIAVDNLTRADKFRNLTDCEIADYVDKERLHRSASAPATSTARSTPCCTRAPAPTPWRPTAAT